MTVVNALSSWEQDMAFSETGKVWMNGKLVDWKDATIHVATHVVHYGSGVFEGIRAYDSKNGTNVFRLPEHMRRLWDSCRVYRMEPALHARAAQRGRARNHSRQRLQVVLHPSADLSRLRAAGRQPDALPGRGRDHRVGVGRVSRATMRWRKGSTSASARGRGLRRTRSRPWPRRPPTTPTPV